MTNKAQAQKAILSKIQAQALGNSDRGMKELASDLIGEMGGKKACKLISEQAYLTPSTVARVFDCDEKYNPQLQTIERILRVCGCRIHADYVSIKGAYMPKPKE